MSRDYPNLVEDLNTTGLFGVVFVKHNYLSHSEKMPEYLNKQFSTDVDPNILLNNQ